MLGTVARKLRVFGFDTLYVAHVDDSEILKIGVDQNRIILTADREFFKRIVKAGAEGVLVDASDEVEDLVHILERTGIESVQGAGPRSRCSACNGALAFAPRSEIEDKLPERVLAGHSEFMWCSTCGKVYWQGSHVRRIRRLAEALNSRLQSK